MKKISWRELFGLEPGTEIYYSCQDGSRGYAKINSCKVGGKTSRNRIISPCVIAICESKKNAVKTLTIYPQAFQSQYIELYPVVKSQRFYTSD